MLTSTQIERIVLNILSAHLVTPAAVSFLVCLSLVLMAPGILKLFSRREDLHAVQAAHTKPTLRIGGLGILAGVLAGTLLLSADAAFLSYASLILVSAIPLILGGFAEDLGFQVPPRLRLGAIAISALLCATFLPAVLTHIGVPVIDDILTLYPLALMFTIFAASGVTNAFNLIDGLNGLASFTAITTASPWPRWNCGKRHRLSPPSGGILMELNAFTPVAPVTTRASS